MRSLDEEREHLQSEQDALVRALIEPSATSRCELDEDAVARARCVLRAKRTWIEVRRGASRPAQSRWARLVRALGLG